jgi:hypothetical protein
MPFDELVDRAHQHKASPTDLDEPQFAVLDQLVERRATNAAQFLPGLGDRHKASFTPGLGRVLSKPFLVVPPCLRVDWIWRLWPLGALG